MISVSVTLSDWLFRAVMSKSVLTLSRDYFGLRKPLEPTWALVLEKCSETRQARL